MRVGEAMTANVICCTPQTTLVGVFSIDDILEKAGEGGGVSCTVAVTAFQEIGGRPSPMRRL